MSLSKAERAFVRDGIEQNVRVDGRARDDYRSMTLELGVVPQASGSARLRLGATDVMVAVKADIGTPPRENPDHGRLQCSVELSASADPAYEGRGGESLGVELGKSLERSLLGASAGGSASLSAAASGERGATARAARHGAGAALDMSQLCIQRGKTCWLLQCDALVLNADGSVLDALSVAARAALADARIPKVTAVAGPNPDDPAELELDDDPEECSRLDVSGVPLIVTLTRVGAHAVVDATEDEETHAAAGVSVAVDAAGRIRAVGKRGGGGIDLGVVRGMMKTARDVGKKLIAAVDGFLLAAESGAGEEEDDEEDAMET
jgi:exosome complex component RRP42